MNKTLLSLALALCGFCASGAEWITGTLTITNSTFQSNASLTVNGLERWAWSSVSATNWLGTNTPAKSATNLFTQLGSWPFAGVIVSWGSPTGLVLKGIGLTASCTNLGGASNWATLSFTTNFTTNVLTMLYPFTSLPANVQTNEGSEIVNGFSYASNAVPEATGALSNFVSRGGVQQMGNKDMTNSTVNGFKATNGFLQGIGVSLTNATGIVGSLSNGIAQAWKLTNATVHITSGYASNVVGVNMTFTNLQVPGKGTGSFQVGSGADAAGDYSMVAGDSAVCSNAGGLALGQSAVVMAAAGVAVGQGSTVFGNSGMAFGYGASATANYSLAVGYTALATGVNAVAIGNAVSASNNQAVIGLGSMRVDIPGMLQAGAITNSTFRGSNLLDGILCLKPRSMTSLANGNNAGVVIGTNVYVRMSGGSANVTNAGFLAGHDGEFHFLQITGQTTLVILNNSGVDPSAANRILTGTGGDIVMTNNPAFLHVIYDGAVNFWRVMFHSQ